MGVMVGRYGIATGSTLFLPHFFQDLAAFVCDFEHCLGVADFCVVNQIDKRLEVVAAWDEDIFVDVVAIGVDASLV